MDLQDPSPCPFVVEVLENTNRTTDLWPALYHSYETCGKKTRRVVANPADNVPAFLATELSLGNLGTLPYLWLTGSRRAAKPLHLQVAIGRDIVVADRMDLHLIWDHDGHIFVKPFPSFLLSFDVWRCYLACPKACSCEGEPAPNHATSTRPPTNEKLPSCREGPRSVALGFLYTYACLVASESDFFVANQKRLLPRHADDTPIAWPRWKTLVRELLATYDPAKVHPRFLRAELRLTRINIIYFFTHLPPFNLYLRGWHTYRSLFRDNFAWMAAVTIIVALVLSAMQVDLATDRLQGNATFQQVSYGFTIFAILVPLCVFGLVVLLALLNLLKDLPGLREEARAASLPTQRQLRQGSLV